MSTIPPEAQFASAPSTAKRPLKIPPHSQEAEQSVLGALMIDNRAWDRVVDRIHTQDGTTFILHPAVIEFIRVLLDFSVFSYTVNFQIRIVHDDWRLADKFLEILLKKIFTPQQYEIIKNRVKTHPYFSDPAGAAIQIKDTQDPQFTQMEESKKDTYVYPILHVPEARPEDFVIQENTDSPGRFSEKSFLGNTCARNKFAPHRRGDKLPPFPFLATPPHDTNSPKQNIIDNAFARRNNLFYLAGLLFKVLTAQRHSPIYQSSRDAVRDAVIQVQHVASIEQWLFLPETYALGLKILSAANPLLNFLHLYNPQALLEIRPRKQAIGIAEHGSWVDPPSYNKYVCHFHLCPPGETTDQIESPKHKLEVIHCSWGEEPCWEVEIAHTKCSNWSDFDSTTWSELSVDKWVENAANEICDLVGGQRFFYCKKNPWTDSYHDANPDTLRYHFKDEASALQFVRMLAMHGGPTAFPAKAKIRAPIPRLAAFKAHFNEDASQLANSTPYYQCEFDRHDFFKGLSERYTFRLIGNKIIIDNLNLRAHWRPTSDTNKQVLAMLSAVAKQHKALLIEPELLWGQFGSSVRLQPEFTFPSVEAAVDFLHTLAAEPYNFFPQNAAILKWNLNKAEEATVTVTEEVAQPKLGQNTVSLFGSASSTAEKQEESDAEEGWTLVTYRKANR